jgi:hypothetical protein
MKAYIKVNNNNEIASPNFYAAFDGFKQMGFEIDYFKQIPDIVDHEKQDIIVGYIGDVKHALTNLGLDVPAIDYPDELKAYYGRNIWSSKLSEIANNPDKWGVFVKPKEQKKFTGVVVRGTRDLVGCGTYGEDPDIFCSDVVNIVAEWRCFIRYGQILDIRRYNGNWRAHFDPSVVERAVKAYTGAPAGYSMDFGLTDKGETIVIEVNDGYALGQYGLTSVNYAKLMAARWAELTGTIDECNF